jgi:FkbM family methyltransferase
MLISVQQLKWIWNINPKSILHVGAHKGEELPMYLNANWGDVGIYLIEAQEELAIELATKVSHKRVKVLQAAVWSEDNVEMNFHVTSNSESSSLLDLDKHLEKYPEITEAESYSVFTKRIDSLIPRSISFDFINLDIQGAELEALKGLGGHLESIKWIYTEVNRLELYKNCAQIADIDLYLENFGFIRADVCWVRGKGWGDALYIKADAVSWVIIRRVLANLFRIKFQVRHLLSECLTKIKLLKNLH